MGAKGITIGEELHTLLSVAPVDINGAGATSDIWNMRNYAHCTIVCGLGVTGAATTITVEECDDVTPSNSTAIAFSYYAETTAAGDTLGARTAATTAGITGSTNDGVFYVIEIDASQLTDGFPYLRVVFSDPSAATLATAVVILSGARYAEVSSATALT